ncbi:MAG TPA: hypothetical protein VHV78_13490 [Gemmatimonadaceae bacterium]|jgi:hypothetical protein|nr:hypothetical protein [Gemmatimonadaceae bacterium]
MKRLGLMAKRTVRVGRRPPEDRAPVTGMLLMSTRSKYFWYRHASADMMTVTGRDDFSGCIAMMAAMAYVLADLDGAIPRRSAQDS